MTDGDGRGLVRGIVSDVLQGMRNNPSCLAATVMAVAFAFVAYQTLTAEREEAHKRTMTIIAKCFPNGETPPAVE